MSTGVGRFTACSCCDNKMSIDSIDKGTQLPGRIYEASFYREKGDHKHPGVTCKKLTSEPDWRIDCCWAALMSLDLVAFKVMNDRFSQDFGDKTLQHFGKAFADIVLEDDLPAKCYKSIDNIEIDEFHKEDVVISSDKLHPLPVRHGGEEFALLFLYDGHCELGNTDPFNAKRLDNDCAQKRRNRLRGALWGYGAKLQYVWEHTEFRLSFGEDKEKHPRMDILVPDNNAAQNASLYLKGLGIRFGFAEYWDRDKADKQSKPNTSTWPPYYDEGKARLRDLAGGNIPQWLDAAWENDTNFRYSSVERGIINDECMIGYPDGREIKWLPFAHHLVIISDKHRVAQDDDAFLTGEHKQFAIAVRDAVLENGDIGRGNNKDLRKALVRQIFSEKWTDEGRAESEIKYCRVGERTVYFVPTYFENLRSAEKETDPLVREKIENAQSVASCKLYTEALSALLRAYRLDQSLRYYYLNGTEVFGK